MKAENCYLTVRNTPPLKTHAVNSVKGKSKKVEVIFCAVSNGIIEAPCIKPEKFFLRMFFLCWKHIKGMGDKRTVVKTNNP
ncbi:hypothetical protein MA998_004568 [Escherichia coli]|nr:hypothetical protein [Escherichia coli]EIX9599918.1 hypothetical protein [Klebsiella pneumoniae]HBW6184039.1 hypothetical protein [Klebsiella pneumoniae]